jgi:imidazolonepropionase-like amidohydrolase
MRERPPAIGVAISGSRLPRLGRAALGIGLAVLAGTTSACQARLEAPPGAAGRAIALVGGTVRPAADTPAIADGVVVVESGRIGAVGRRGEVRIPGDATFLDCAGATVLAGFWNSHVHFIGATWESAASAPAEGLAGALRAMLTSYGFVRVLDTGSRLANTLALRRRVESGEVPGPYIMTTGTGFVPAGGSPFYILPARLPELTRVEDVAGAIQPELEAGADALKLFTGSFARERVIVAMPVEIVRAAVAVAHRRRALVVAHPSNSAGARAALEGGVDVLAHTFPAELDGAWDRSLPAAMRERGMGLIPTLKLWPFEMRKFGAPPEIANRLLANGQAQLAAFGRAGGQVLFGTDVGYMTDFDPTDEYVFMQGAGLSFAQILAALTRAPAERFGATSRSGRLLPGLDADIAVVEGDPERDIRALAAVRYTLRSGRVVYARSP